VSIYTHFFASYLRELSAGSVPAILPRFLPPPRGEQPVRTPCLLRFGRPRAGRATARGAPNRFGRIRFARADALPSERFVPAHPARPVPRGRVSEMVHRPTSFSRDPSVIGSRPSTTGIRIGGGRYLGVNRKGQRREYFYSSSEPDPSCWAGLGEALRKRRTYGQRYPARR
jgi:hypothetical protein